jgi:hypothetical protein
MIKIRRENIGYGQENQAGGQRKKQSLLGLKSAGDPASDQLI